MNKKNRREFLKISAIAAAGLSLSNIKLFSSPFSKNVQNVKRPNILLIMADDMGFSDIGSYGGEISTPNIDRLAMEGIRFTQFYNAARCCPTRASLLTGLYSHQVGMGGMVTRNKNVKPGPYQGYLSNNCVTLAEVLRTAGYKTYMSGKWHVGEFEPQWPHNRGFDKYYGLVSGAMNYFNIKKDKEEGIKRVFIKDNQPYDPPAEGFYATDAFTNEALKFLDGHNYQEPFFLYLAYTAPHWPLHALPEDISKYKGKYLSGWNKLREERWKRQIELGIIDSSWELSPPDPEAMKWEDVPDKERMDLKMAIYAAQIERMDTNIGKVIEKLKSMNQLENTFIIFLSDNGACAEEGPLGFDGQGGWNGELGTEDSFSSYGRSWSNASNTPFRLHKQWVHEGGISTPFIVRYPEMIKKGTMTNQVGHVIDIMPTLIEIAKADYPSKFNGNNIMPLEGKSLIPILKGNTRQPHEKLCWEHLKNKAIRKGDWKLVSVSDGEWELYNMKNDRTEIHNLAFTEPSIVKKLVEDYTSWADKVGAAK